MRGRLHQHPRGSLTHAPARIVRCPVTRYLDQVRPTLEWTQLALVALHDLQCDGAHTRNWIVQQLDDRRDAPIVAQLLALTRTGSSRLILKCTIRQLTCAAA